MILPRSPWITAMFAFAILSFVDPVAEVDIQKNHLNRNASKRKARIPNQYKTTTGENRT